MKSYKRISIVLLIVIASVYGVARLYYRLTDDFRLSNITHDLSNEKGWDLPRLPKDEENNALAILDQPFYYIGKGAQCYAFESNDKKYVLKFFKFKHLRPIWLVQILPSVYPFKSIKEDAAQRKRKKLHSVFDGYELAYQEHRKEAEILYLHLKPTNYLNKIVTVYDKIGFKHHVNIDEVVFLLQKKGETLRNRMNRLLKEGNFEQAKKSLSGILEMYIQEYNKGLYDRDHGVMHNTGYVGNTPFHLDVGKFTKDEEMRKMEICSKDLEHIAWKMDVWFKNSHPEDYAIFSPYIAKEYNRLTGYNFDVSTIDSSRFKKKKK